MIIRPHTSRRSRHAFFVHAVEQRGDRWSAQFARQVDHFTRVRGLGAFFFSNPNNNNGSTSPFVWIRLSAHSTSLPLAPHTCIYIHTLNHGCLDSQSPGCPAAVHGDPDRGKDDECLGQVERRKGETVCEACSQSSTILLYLGIRGNALRVPLYCFLQNLTSKTHHFVDRPCACRHRRTCAWPSWPS